MPEKQDRGSTVVTHPLTRKLPVRLQSISPVSNVVSQYNLMVCNVKDAVGGSIEIVLACLKACIKQFQIPQEVSCVSAHCVSLRLS